MWSNIKEWLSSKKTKAMLTGLLGLVIAAASGEVEWKAILWPAVGIVGTYLGAQGAADWGKSKALVEKTPD